METQTAFKSKLHSKRKICESPIRHGSLPGTIPSDFGGVTWMQDQRNLKKMVPAKSLRQDFLSSRYQVLSDAKRRQEYDARGRCQEGFIDAKAPRFYPSTLLNKDAFKLHLCSLSQANLLRS